MATSVEGVKILINSQVARKTEKNVFLEDLLEPDEELILYCCAFI
jgi:hypothetical protein